MIIWEPAEILLSFFHMFTIWKENHYLNFKVLPMIFPPCMVEHSGTVNVEKYRRHRMLDSDWTRQKFGKTNPIKNVTLSNTLLEGYKFENCHTNFESLLKQLLTAHQTRHIWSHSPPSVASRQNQAPVTIAPLLGTGTSVSNSLDTSPTTKRSDTSPAAPEYSNHKKNQKIQGNSYNIQASISSLEQPWDHPLLAQKSGTLNKKRLRQPKFRPRHINCRVHNTRMHCGFPGRTVHCNKKYPWQKT